MASIAPTPQAARDERGNATIDDLLAYDGNAELVNGRIVPKMVAGNRHSFVSGHIYAALLAYQRTHGGRAFPDGVGFQLTELSSGRQTFSPDASWIAVGPPASEEGVVAGPPTLAVEVRSPQDYTASGLTAASAKRAEYFEAGTLAVWDVDPRAGVIHLFAAATDQPTATFATGDDAHAGAAMPGLAVPVRDVFET